MRSIYVQHRGDYYVSSWPSGDGGRLNDQELTVVRSRKEITYFLGATSNPVTRDDADDCALVISLQSLKWVVAKYGDLSAESLSRMTHAEAPWRLARGTLHPSERSEETIPREAIRRFYARHQTDPDVAVTLVAASTALEGVEMNDEWLEELRQIAYGHVTADELAAKEILRIKGK